MFKVGIIGSSGGSALAAASGIISQAGHEVEYSVLTDRDCGILTWGLEHAKYCKKIDFVNSETFSSSAEVFFKAPGCETILLFFTRLVSSELFDEIDTWNIHPALLPSFPGLHGVDDAISAGAKILGATLHLVDEGMDTGPIQAQISSPLPASYSNRMVHRLSYIQKVWLTLVWFETIYLKKSHEFSNFQYGPINFVACPSIGDQNILHCFSDWLKKLEVEE